MIISKDVAKAKLQKMTLIKRPSRGRMYSIYTTHKEEKRARTEVKVKKLDY